MCKIGNNDGKSVEKTEKRGESMKTDARVRYTRRVIKESLLRLLEDRPVKRITVKEVCEAAQINRATFYAHFTDCFDVLNQMENDLLADFERSLSFASVVDVVDMIERIYAMIDQNAEVCRVLIFQNKDSSLTAKMIAMAHDKTIVRWKEQLTRAMESDREMLFTCLSNGLLNVILTGYSKYEREEVVKFVSETVRLLITPYL